MTRLRTHYDNLKVARDAPDFVIRAAYKTLSQKYHPDKHPGDEHATKVMALVNQSYEVLSDPVRRQAHDAWIAQTEAKLRQQQAQSPPASNAPQQQSQVQPEVSQKKRSALSPLWRWPLKLLAAFPQLGLVLFLGLCVWLWDELGPKRSPPPGPKPYQAVAPARPAAKPAFVPPATAPNGSPWPAGAAYVKGYPIDYADGYSKLTVDNSRNDADVFGKLVSLDGTSAFPVRQFFIPAGSRFTMNKLTSGHYDLRYLDLKTGGLSRSEAFDITEERTAEGIRYDNMTVTLYKMHDGNFDTYDLSPDEF
ncbi:MAG: J domain-containing protein [Xanthomonadales bacterium]|nr:J domain-containing protein [Xanthomonadales bacterium]